MNGKCRLCLEQSKLCNSHVIPEFCFKPTYDEKHRAIESKLTAKGTRFIQKGYREYLFCGVCEQKFNKYETYFSKLWFQGDFPQKVCGKMYTLQGIDYTNFKLFHLSILFRASVSSLHQFFAVNLGNNEEIIRKMILDEAPGDENTFPLMSQLLFDPEDMSVVFGIIVQPEGTRIDGHHVYSFVFAGCNWVYCASKICPENLIPPVLSRNGKLHLDCASVYDHPRIREFAKNLANTRRRNTS